MALVDGQSTGERRWVTDADGRFVRDYDRASFPFEHALGQNPLFELDNLIALAGRLERFDDSYWSNGAVEVGDRWEAGTARRPTLRETLTDIAHNDSLVMLKYGVHDAVAGPFLRGLLTSLIALVGEPMRGDVLRGRATILIASPHRVTPYHNDADVNFLFQVKGRKSFSVFNPTDRTLLTEPELEHYFTGDFNGATYKADRQKDSVTYDLLPGHGVHVPTLAPHWARNGDDVSVAVSCNFDLRSTERRARLYRINHRLRRLGLNPSPPGARPPLDGAKLAAAGLVRAARNLVRGSPPADPAAWTPE